MKTKQIDTMDWALKSLIIDEIIFFLRDDYSYRNEIVEDGNTFTYGEHIFTIHNRYNKKKFEGADSLRLLTMIDNLKGRTHYLTHMTLSEQRRDAINNIINS